MSSCNNAEVQDRRDTELKKSASVGLDQPSSIQPPQTSTSKLSLSDAAVNGTCTEPEPPKKSDYRNQIEYDKAVEEFKPKWLLYWVKCRKQSLCLGPYCEFLAAMCPSIGTEFTLPDDDVLKKWCGSCENSDPVKKMKCLNEKIHQWIGKPNIGLGPKQRNCNDFASIYMTLATHCKMGVDYQDGLQPITDDSHAWNFVENKGKCFLVDAFNEIVFEVPCPPSDTHNHAIPYM